MPRKKKLRSSDLVVQTLVEATALGDRLQVELDELKGLIPGRLREAAAEGSRWSVRVIRAGESLNRNRYPAAVLEAAVHLFEGVPTYAVSDAEHAARVDPPLNRDVNRMVGRITEPRFVREGTGGEIRAALEIVNPAGEFGRWLVEAARRGMHENTFGLSMVASARKRRGSQEVREILAVESVDFVVKPSAGGRILKLIEGVEDRPVTRATDTNTDDREKQLIEAVSLVESCGLPKAARKRLKKKLKKANDITEAAVSQLIVDERSYIHDLNEGHPGAAVTGLGGTGRVSITEGREERIPKMLDALLDPKDKSAVSLREAYIELTGDKRVTGDMRNIDRTRLSEAITVGSGSGVGVFAQVFGDSLTRRMQTLYNESMPIYDWYKMVSTEVPVMDFRTQRRVRWGGYGDLPTVAQGAAYAALTSPTDEEETYSATKKGGTEVITLESIKNDDVGVVMSLPRRLAMAAKRTLSGTVAGLFTANSGAGQTLNADSKNLFHADHNNSGTAALSAAAVAAGRLAMVKQTEMDSSKQIGIEPKALLVPFELQETAYNLFKMGTRNDRDFVQSFMYEILPVPGWTDANDWVLAADPMMVETCEVGYLDGNMEPALLMQSDETYGSMFTNDQWTYKIRHIYGVTIMDHRGFYKGIVV